MRSGVGVRETGLWGVRGQLSAQAYKDKLPNPLHVELTNGFTVRQLITKVRD